MRFFCEGMLAIDAQRPRGHARGAPYDSAPVAADTTAPPAAGDDPEQPTHGAPPGAGGIARNTAIFSAATGLSRIAGLVREIVASSYFATSGAFSAFTIAFQVPNLVRTLLVLIIAILGAITAFFILAAGVVMPQFTGHEFTSQLDHLTVGLSRVLFP